MFAVSDLKKKKEKEQKARSDRPVKVATDKQQNPKQARGSQKLRECVTRKKEEGLAAAGLNGACQE